MNGHHTRNHVQELEYHVGYPPALVRAALLSAVHACRHLLLHLVRRADSNTIRVAYRSTFESIELVLRAVPGLLGELSNGETFVICE